MTGLKESATDNPRESLNNNKEERSAAHVDAIAYEDEPAAHLHLKTYLVTFAVFCIYFAQLYNLVGLGALGRDVSAVVGGSDKITWLVNSVAIFTAVLSPPVCQAADYWGRRLFLVYLSLFGIVGSIIISRATSMGMAIGGACIVGISYGAQPLIHAITSEVLPRKYRPVAQAVCNVAIAMGGLIGLLVGGALTRNGNSEGFRVYWYISAGLYACSVIISFLFYRPPVRELQTTLTFSEKIQRLDWIGYALLSCGLVLFSLGLCYGDNPFPWTNAIVLTPFLIGCGFLLALGFYEWKIKKDGMFHHALFSSGRNFAIGLICILGEGLTFFGANSYYAFQISTFYETDALLVGVRYGIAFIIYVLASVAGGIYCSRYKKVRWPTIIGLGSFVVFNVCMATTTPTSDAPTWGYVVFVGLGLGLCLCAVVSAAQLTTPPELISITSGLLISMRSVAGVIGLPIYSAVFNSKLSANLGEDIAQAVLPLGLPESSLPALIEDLLAHITSTPDTVPGVTEEIYIAGAGGMLDAFSVAFRFVWITAGVLACCAAITAIFLYDPKHEFNMHIDAPAEKVEDLYDADIAEAIHHQHA